MRLAIKPVIKLDLTDTPEFPTTRGPSFAKICQKLPTTVDATCRKISIITTKI